MQLLGGSTMRYIFLLIVVFLTAYYLFATESEAKKEDVVKSLKPHWISTQLRKQGVDNAVLSLCGGELHSCKEAKKKLVLLTEQCSNVFMGIIDVDEYTGFPRDIYGTKDPELILLGKPWGLNSLLRFDITERITPDTFAAVMCPEESRVFGSILRLFRWILPN